MDYSLFSHKDMFPQFVSDKLYSVVIDYKDKHELIANSNSVPIQLAAGVVLLINYRTDENGSEYVFQLIKRSNTVTQAGDISCPGGIVHQRFDRIISNLLKTGIIPTVHGHNLNSSQFGDKETASLIRLFLTTALREAWEEVGLNPFNVMFLGALPCYSLSFLARTIFPVVCLTGKPFQYKLSSEVDKILEVPVIFFFDQSNYAMLEIKTAATNDPEHLLYQMPCLVIPDGLGGEDVLWGATFNIITNFLRIISDDGLPAPSSSRTIDKVLTHNYITGKTGFHVHINN
jgi:8-oxo-dGTP pyrophosphatase MutT (NUDIX family)